MYLSRNPWPLLKAVASGILLAAVGTIPWAYLVKLNLKFHPGIPWSILPMILYLLLFWKFVKGESWPQSTSQRRKENLRAKSLTADVWGAALLAGILGLVSLGFFQNVYSQLVTLPQQEIGPVKDLPRGTVFLLIVMGSVVAGVVEESSFRGYMQHPIEKHYGPFIAMLITGVLFGLAHFSHAETTFALMPFYFYVAVIYGMLAYLSGSILPGMAIHIGGDIWVGLILLVSGQSEWQTSSTPARTIWETRARISFWISCVIFLISFAAAAWAYSSLKRVAGKSVRL
jgi:membrane protease YdiL (CAAX protease family)